jgi:hypothetical protein
VPWSGSRSRCARPVEPCPEVDITEHEVRIGEAGNLAVLKKAEWNVLVDLIQSGQLQKL